jgi:hypothetical protein
MNHNGGFPPIYEGGKKEIVQREFTSKNILSLNEILNNNQSSKIEFKRTNPITFNIIDKKPKFKK